MAAGIKDLAARTAGVTGRSVERGADKEPRTAPVMMFDVTERMHAAEQKAAELAGELASAKLHSGPQLVALSLIDDSPYQPRTLYDKEELDLLAASLVSAGQKEPVTIRPISSGRYELIAGHRRTHAARSLGWTDIDAHVVEQTDREAELATMVSNEARVDLTDYERAKLYQAAIAEGFAKNQTEVGNLFGTTQERVSRRMAMLKLPVDYVLMLEARPDLFGCKCAEQIAQMLKKYPAEATLIQAAVDRIATEGADQNSVKQWVQQMINQRENRAQRKGPAIVTDSSGRAIFTANTSGRELTIKINADEIDAKEVEELVLITLRQRAEKPKL